MGVTRRQLLHALWSAPALGGFASAFAASVSGCRCQRAIPGELKGPNFAVGHRVRDEQLRVAHATGPAHRCRVVIVGSGPSGLSAAWKLRRSGIEDFLVLDLEQQAGGTSACETSESFSYPWGAHYVPLPLPHNRHLIELLDEVGVLATREPPRAKERYLARAPQERVFFDGRWHSGLFPMHGATETERTEFERFEQEVERLASLRDGRGRRAFTIPSALGSDNEDWTAWDRQTARDWLLTRGFSSERLHWYVDYACRDDYGTSLEQTSAWAMLFYFASRRDSEASTSQPFVTWPEGNGALVRHLTRLVGERLWLDRMATDVVQDEHGVTLAVLDVRTNRLERIEAEYAIIAVPRFIATRIVRELSPSTRPADETSRYGSWLVANLHLSGRPASNQPELAWDSVLYGSPSLGYVDAGFQSLHDRGPTVWTYYHPLTESDPKLAREYLLSSTFDDLATGIVAELEVAHPDLRDFLTRLDIWRWGHAMVRPTPGVIWNGELAAARAPLGRIHFAHTDLSGLALFEESQYWAVLAAERIKEALAEG